ncbi:spindle pole body component 110-like [Dorcoceras hygrometricum]|uniref:Spindle pole body component 110-like n=1 Tax=Dorcoceras hygrometricum TaxID=472368 RepID=A0A2Z7CLR9_9LAMI|nr:spindle pole body component 110-like [Dorcoceras hygrometricum]
MRTRGDKRTRRKNDRKVLMAEESTKSWADTDSDSSSSRSSSSESEQEEVHCLMANQTSDDQVFDFSNIEFTREDLVSALNDMVKEYMKLSHSFEEIKAENENLKNSSIESRTDTLEDIDSLMMENELLRNEFSELKAEIEKSNLTMSSWAKSSTSLDKLFGVQKPASDRTGLGFNGSENSSGETSTKSQLVYDKINKMSFVKASVIHDPYESMTYNDQTSQKSNHKVKVGIGFQKPENSKPSWLKNKLDKDKAKAGSKSFVPNQPRRNSTKVKSGWRKVRPRRDINGQNMKSTLNRSHRNFAQTLTDSSTGKTVKT